MLLLDRVEGHLVGAAGTEGAERASVWLDVLCANLVGGAGISVRSLVLDAWSGCTCLWVYGGADSRRMVFHRPHSAPVRW